MSEFAKEEKIKAGLEAKFPGVVTNASVQRKNRVWAEAATEKLPEVLEWLKAEGFIYLSTITGFDEGENFGAFYHLSGHGMVASIKVKTPKTNPALPSVLPVFPVATSYERELEDMFGIKVQGLPPGRRYPLPDDFPTDQYPLRKDWTDANLPAWDAPAKEAK
ncbi:MAG TPA: proton-conducting membrane transporter [Elusimicrobia bacterium]|nr:proton-conducting membrane transporter [Elusimicrobiota bacterium]